MPRRDPGKIVGYVEDDVSKVRTELRLLNDSTEGTVFFARVGENSTRHKDGDVVKKWIKEQHRAMRNVEWTPIIVVDFSSFKTPSKPYLNDRQIEEAVVGEINFVAYRSYVARIGEAIRELDWEDYAGIPDSMGRVDASYRFGSCPPDALGKLPWSPKRDRWDNSIDIVLAYDEQTWAGLVAIVNGIERSRLALKTILREVGPAAEFLQAVGSGRAPIGALLSGPAVDEEDDDEDDDE